MDGDSTAHPPIAVESETNLRHEQTNDLPGYISAASGAISGLVAGVAVCPFDVVKTRLQVQSSFPELRGQKLSITDTFCKIYHEQGAKGLYSGLSPLLVGYLPAWTIYFYVYKKFQHQGKGHDTIPSAVVAGACSTVATNPIWVIKTRMMTQSRHTSWQYTSMLDAAKNMYRSEGIGSFYSGLGAAMLGLPHVAIHFPFYEYLKSKWAPHKEWQGFLAASIVSKVVASTVTYPHEVIRSRAQINTDGRYRGVLNTIRTLYMKEGLKGFYAGLGANVCRAVPASAVTLMTFEMASNFLTEIYRSHHNSLAS